MADASGYPQIPTTVWWGLRPILKKRPSAKIDETFLGVELGVQASAAKQYINELQKVGLLDAEGATTELSNKWKFDDSYKEAAEQILRTAYPEALVNLAPFGEADRAKVTDWFMRQGLGEGTAKNKAATYVLIANEDVQEAGEPRAPRAREASTTTPKRASPSRSAESNTGRSKSSAPSHGNEMPLHVNVQIHIGADASKDQIESIFSAMRRHLYANEAD